MGVLSRKKESRGDFGASVKLQMEGTRCACVVPSPLGSGSLGDHGHFRSWEAGMLVVPSLMGFCPSACVLRRWAELRVVSVGA